VTRSQFDEMFPSAIEGGKKGGKKGNGGRDSDGGEDDQQFMSHRLRRNGGWPTDAMWQAFDQVRLDQVRSGRARSDQVRCHFLLSERVFVCVCVCVCVCVYPGVSRCVPV
jgi:hypothetical protein